VCDVDEGMIPVLDIILASWIYNRTEVGGCNKMHVLDLRHGLSAGELNLDSLTCILFCFPSRISKTILLARKTGDIELGTPFRTMLQ
jgi:hypothetical protein